MNKETKSVILLIILTMTVLFSIEIVLELNALKNSFYKSADIILSQVEDILQTNEKDELETYEYLKDDYLVKARACSYLIENSPDIELNSDELKRIAFLMQVDEIHLFNKAGSIYGGTNPEYFGLNIKDGEQISFFKPLLEDTSLYLCQNLTPNTANNTMMMYAMVWRKDKKGLIQIGVTPNRLLKQMENNRIETLLKKMPFKDGITVSIFDSSTKIIKGSTNEKLLSKNINNIYLRFPATVVNSKKCSLSDGSFNYYSLMRPYKNYTLIITSRKHAVLKESWISIIIVFLSIVVISILFYVEILRAAKQLKKTETENQKKLIEAEQEKQELLQKAYEEAEHARIRNAKLVEDTNKAFNLIHETLQSSLWRMNFDKHGNMISVKWSDELRKMIGYNDTTDFPNTLESWSDKIHPNDKDRVLKDYYDTIDDYTGEKTFKVEYQLMTKSGQYKWFHSSGRLSRKDDGTPITFVGLFIDITEKKSQEKIYAQLQYDIKTDKLTGLRNRGSYEGALERLKNYSHLEKVTFVALDVNGLKTINDNIGHSAGDELLKGAATCIENFFGEYGKCYRTGGDEFMVIIKKEIKDVEMLKHAFKNIIQQWKGETVDKLAISIGIVQAKDNMTLSIPDMLKLADKEMYEDKNLYYKNSGINRRKN